MTPKRVGNSFSKKGYKVVVAGVRVTDEQDETGKCTSGGVLIGVESIVAGEVQERSGKKN